MKTPRQALLVISPHTTTAEECKVDSWSGELNNLATAITLDTIICLIDATKFINLHEYEKGKEVVDVMEALTTISSEAEKRTYTQQQSTERKNETDFEILKTALDIE